MLKEAQVQDGLRSTTVKFDTPATLLSKLRTKGWRPEEGDVLLVAGTDIEILSADDVPEEDKFSLVLKRNSTENDVGSSQPLAILYSASYGGDKARIFSSQTPLDAPLPFQNLRSAVEEHYFGQLAGVTWSLKSGPLPIKDDEDLALAVKLARNQWDNESEQKKKKKKVPLVIVNITVVETGQRAFNSFDTLHGMAALVGDAFANLPKEEQRPERAKTHFCDPVKLDAHMNKVVDLGNYGPNNITVKQLVTAMAEDMSRTMAIMPWDTVMKEAGRRLHMDPIICTSLILFATIEELDIKNVQLRVEHALKGREASGYLDYAILVLMEVLVMLEAKHVQPREHEGQVLAQMSAVKHTRVGQKRKRNEEGHEQVFGLISNATQWYIYKYDSAASPPVQYYSMMLNLDDKFLPADVELAVQPILEFLLGVYKKCLDTSPLERPAKKLAKS